MKQKLQMILIMLGMSFGLLLAGMATEAKAAAEKIVFMSGPDLGLRNVFTMNPDGTGLTNLTNNTGQNESPSLSKDGTKIVFSSSRSGSFAIHTMNVDGSNVTNLGVSGSRPKFSPDGTKIVFSDHRNNNTDIYIMNSDGTNQTLLTTHPYIDSDPSFSPDGTKIVFSSNRNDNFEIYIMNSNGTDQARLTYSSVSNRSPSFSPDGTKIVFSSEAPSRRDIFIMNLDGTGRTNLSNNAADDAFPSFSPDGTKIAFRSTRDNNLEIYSMNSDGTNQTRLTNSSDFDEAPSWGGIPVIDSTPPVITPTVTGTLGNNGWYTSDVQVSWSVADGESTVSAQTGCGAQTVSSDTAGVTFNCEATSAGGMSSQSVTVKRDATAPTVSAVATTSPNAAGWYKTDLTVQFPCEDSLSGISSGACPADQTLSAEGNAVSSAPQIVTDNAGNTSSPSNIVTVSIDKTAPTLAPVVAPNPVNLNAPATASPNATDTLSGIASQSCAAVDTSSAGNKTVACTATDNAGNTANANAGYQVVNPNVYNFTGFFQPIDNLPLENIVSAGQGVPVKFSLGGYQGLNILAAAYPTSTLIACDASAPGDVIEETVNAGDSSLSYDAVTDRYTYVWKTNKAWKGTCRMFVLKLSDGTVHFAKFRFK